MFVKLEELVNRTVSSYSLFQRHTVISGYSRYYTVQYLLFSIHSAPFRLIPAPPQPASFV